MGITESNFLVRVNVSSRKDTESTVERGMEVILGAEKALLQGDNENRPSGVCLSLARSLFFPSSKPFLGLCSHSMVSPGPNEGRMNYPCFYHPRVFQDFLFVEFVLILLISS